MALAVVTSAVAIPLAAQSASDPVELVKRAVANEISTNSSGQKFMFCDHRRTPNGLETRLLIETRQATAALAIARNDRPLSAEERQIEAARLQRFVNDSSELEKKEKREREDEAHTVAIMKAMPQAFLFTPVGTEMGRTGIGKDGDKLVRLNFRPNPKYVPPSHVEQVLTGMEGYMLIDSTQNHIAKIDGTLGREVEFGWGILGHLNRGGHFVIQQGDEGNGEWEITRMDLDFEGKIFLLKKLKIQSSEVFSDFRPVPHDLTFAQGVRMLESQQSEVARNGRATLEQK